MNIAVLLATLVRNFIKSPFRIVMNGTYWALSLFSVDLHEDKMIGYFLSGFVVSATDVFFNQPRTQELPAGLIAIVLILYFGRRSVTVVALVAQSMSMFAAVLFPGMPHDALVT